MYFLKVGWLDLGMNGVYDLERSWAFLSQVDLSDPVVSITSADIEIYNWTQQTITLTEAGTKRFYEAYNAPGPIPMWEDSCFVVTFNGVRVYGGLHLLGGSAMGIKFPVFYFSIVNRRYVFEMRPTHVGGRDPYPSWPAELRSRIEIPEIRDYFIAQAGGGELVWIYRLRPPPADATPGWFLHGRFA